MSGNSFTFVENIHSLQGLSENFLSLLDHTKLFSDVVLQCDGIEIPVHRCILSTRSPVFSKMFQSQMQESLSGKINIVDIRLNVLEVLLKYLYSGKTDYLTEDLAEDLLVAADKYQLEGLKQICSAKLKSVLSVKNILKILVLGDLHDITLKSHAMEYICKLKYSVLKATEEWKLLNTRLAMEIMESIVENVQGSSNLKEKEEYRIPVHCDGTAFFLDVKATDTIQHVREKIQDQEGIPLDELKVFLPTPPLQDNWTLSDYSIKSHSVLHVTRYMEVFVHTIRGPTIILQVKKDSTTMFLKKLVEAREGIPVCYQRLLYGGKQLEDGRSLSYYNIQWNANIFLLLRLRGCGSFRSVKRGCAA